MKENLSKALRSGLALALAVCMLCGMLPVSALAASTVGPKTTGVTDVNGDGVITYVSFGDSVTNGYGMDGYRFSDGTNVLGFRQEVPAAYPALIRDYLSEKGYAVNLEQMAISGFRMDELHWMLCDDYEADSYHNYQFDDWNQISVRRLLRSDNEEAMKSAQELRNKYLDEYGSDDNMIANADAIIMSEYRNAVRDADLITIDLGTNNFGTFVTNTIQEILGLKDLEYEVDFTQYVDAKTAASLEGMLSQMVANMVGGTGTKAYDLAMTLARCLMFGYLGYTENYDGAIEAIYRLNPHAKVIVIDCYTMITGVQLEGGALGENLDLDELYDMFIDLANFYSRELSPYANKVTHATLDNVPALFIDSYKDYAEDKAAEKYPAEQQYLDATAYRLMNEFIMEMMGWDPDEPADRAEFEANVLSNINLLDTYVNNLTDTIQEQVIDANITPQLNTLVGEVESKIGTTITAIDLIYTAVEGVKTARELLPTAQEGVATARAAVAKAAEGVQTAETAVDTAVDGVATAQGAVDTAVSGVNTAKTALDTAIDGVATAESLLDIIVEKVVGNSMFSTSSFMKSIIIGVIEDEVAAMDLSAYGFSNDEETISMLSEEIYEVACIYKNNESDPATAEKLSIIELMRFFLVETKGYSEEEAQKTAALAYDLNAIYEAEGEEAAIKAAIETEVTDDLMATLGVSTKAEAAEKIYFLGTSENEVAVKTAIETQITDDLMATLGVSTKAEAAEMVYFLGTAERETAVKTAIETQVTDEMLAEFGLTDKTKAEAAELIYTLGTADEKTAVITAMKLQVDEATAQAAYGMVEAYESSLENGKTEAEAEEAAVLAGVAASLTEENMAALAAFGISDRMTAAGLVCKVAQLYNANNTDPASDKPAVVACLVALAAELGIEGIDETTAGTGYDLYAGVYKPALEAGKSEEEAKGLAVTAAIKTEFHEPEGLAEAIYAVYKGAATKEQQYLAYFSLMVGVAGIPENVAKAVCTCYTEDLDGEFNDENVKTTMIFFMTQVLEVSAEEAADLYDQYLMYKNLPETLSKIANCDTIYFDALLAATASGNLDLGSIAEKFKAGTLQLDKPGSGASDEEWAAYKSDSALATLYFRFMAQDGVFTHPSEKGQEALYKTAKSKLDRILTAEPDSAIEITPETNLLVLGDFIAADENSYVAKLGQKLGITPNNMSDADFRINEVRYMLDSGYNGDEYTAEAVEGYETAAYKEAVKNSDLIILNVGSMNMGMIAKQLGVYMSTGETYSMKFSSIDNMGTQRLGSAVDGFLDNFSGAFGTDAVGALMLAFETYGYGYTTFADCLDETVEAIQSLNPNADIILVGMYDLLGDAYISANGMYLEMGHFVGHAVDLMNHHMTTYAEMTDNVTYIDVTGTKTPMNTSAATNMMDGGVAGITAAFAKATPTAEGYTYMTDQILCGIGYHTPADAASITWGTWTENNTITASFHCVCCDQKVTVNAMVTSEGKLPTCTEAGDITYTASVHGYACPETKNVKGDATGHNYEATVTAPTCTENGYTTHVCSRCNDTYTDSEVASTGHTYGDPFSWGWTEDYSAANATFMCACGHAEVVEATLTTSTNAPTCVEDGYITITATVTVNNKTYTDTKTQPGTVAGHTYGEPTTWNWAENNLTAEAVFVCSVCDENTEGHTVTMAAKVTAETTEPTCVTAGKTVYTATLEGKDYTDSREVELPATGAHDYGDDHKCTCCGKQDPAFFGSCSYREEAELATDGTYLLTLGGTEVGSYTFTQIEGGWAIHSADKGYLTLKNGSLSYASEPYAWTYSNGCFSAATKSSSNNWWGNIFDGWWGSSSNSKTYYLVASGSDVGVSTSNTNAQAKFYSASSADSHTFGEGVVTAPTCTEKGYTTYICDRCGYTYTDKEKQALGHDYEEVVTAPTCTEEGYTTYTCLVCGDSYVADYEDATGHNIVDGVCANGCGYTEGSTEPEPDKPDPEPEGECVYMAEKNLTSGETYQLTLGGTEVGSYTFTQIEGGWAIHSADKGYLTLSNGSLSYASEPYAWTYSNERFSAATKSSSNNWWGSIFGGWWGSSSGSSSKTYYLVASGGSVAVSTSTSNANAKFYQQVSGEHVYGTPVAQDGKHISTCNNCGDVKSVNCGDPDCELCNPAVPEATVSVNVKITSKSGSNNWWGNIFGNWWGSGASTTYTATITVTAEGTEVDSVAYSTDNGSTWKEGTSFSSTSQINAFDIRVTATNGITYYFEYDNGNVIQVN